MNRSTAPLTFNYEQDTVRPVDVLPLQACKTCPAGILARQEIEAAEAAVDGTRTLVGSDSDITPWTQDLNASPTTCADGSAFAAALASQTIPLLVKELYAFLTCPVLRRF